MINIKEGTLVFVPWRIQGIVRNEERQLNYSIRLLEKHKRYVLNCITKDQNTAMNKLAKFSEKLNKTPRVSNIMEKAKHTKEHTSRITPIKRRRSEPEPYQRLPSIPSMKKQTPSPPKKQPPPHRIGFLLPPRGRKERGPPVSEWPLATCSVATCSMATCPVPICPVPKKPQWPTLATLKRASQVSPTHI